MLVVNFIDFVKRGRLRTTCALLSYTLCTPCAPPPYNFHISLGVSVLLCSLLCRTNAYPPWPVAARDLSRPALLSFALPEDVVPCFARGGGFFVLPQNYWILCAIDLDIV